MKRLTPVAAILIALVLAQGISAQGFEQLANPNFEEGFQRWQGIPEVEVAVGWEPTWLEGNDRQCRQPCYRPEFKPEQQIVAQGQYSQRWFTTFARQFAAIFQRVPVQEGQWYMFSCRVYNISEPDGRMSAFVGINPWGGDVFHRTMIWGEEHIYNYRSWSEVSVTAQAFGGRITVAMGGNNEWPSHNNAVYWDSCRLERVESPTGPTPTPAPTYTPYPTPEPTGEPGNVDYGRIRDIVATVVAEWDRR